MRENTEWPWDSKRILTPQMHYLKCDPTRSKRVRALTIKINDIKLKMMWMICRFQENSLLPTIKQKIQTVNSFSMTFRDWESFSNFSSSSVRVKWNLSNCLILPKQSRLSAEGIHCISGCFKRNLPWLTCTHGAGNSLLPNAGGQLSVFVYWNCPFSGSGSERMFEHEIQIICTLGGKKNPTL